MNGSLSSTPSPRSGGNAAAYLLALPGALLLLAYALVNGVPFVYPDAFVYLSFGETAWQKIGVLPDPALVAVAPPDGGGASLAPAPPSLAGEERGLSAGRSIYYGALSALPGPFPAPWNGVLVQAYCVALTMALAWRTALGRIGPGYVAAMGAAGLLTTGGIFAATAMPDIWAATGILAASLLVVARDRLTRLDAFALWAFVLFAALAHSSHLATLAALVLVLTFAQVTRLAAPGWRVVAILTGLLIVAVLLSAGARLAMERSSGRPLREVPFLTAHLIDGGPGMEFIRDTCPGSGFAVCERADVLPAEWRHFLFVISAASPSLERRLAAEDARFAFATLRHDPAGVVALALRDAVRQMAMIGLPTTPIRADIGESGMLATSTHPLADRVRDGRLYDAGWLYPAIATSNRALVLAGLAALAVILVRPGGAAGAHPLRALVATCLAGVLLNAVICGVLASPYDRFQARVAWLIPVMALLAAMTRSRHSERRTATPTGQETAHELR